MQAAGAPAATAVATFVGSPGRTGKRFVFFFSFVAVLTNLLAGRPYLFKTTTQVISSERGAAAAGSPNLHRRRRLAVLTICTASTPFANDTLSLNEAYCRLHNCTFINGEPEGHGDLDRVRAVLDLLKSDRYDFVMWMDCDAAFVDETIPPDRVLDRFFVSDGSDEEEGGEVGMVVSRHYDHATPWTRSTCRVPLIKSRRYRYDPSKSLPLYVDPSFCGVNNGVFVVRNNDAGLTSLETLLDIMQGTNGGEGSNHQIGFDVLLMRLYRERGRSQRIVTVVYSEEMNRHLPPYYHSQTAELWTAEAFRASGAWSDAPTWIVHPWGQAVGIRTKFFRCAVDAKGRAEDLVDRCGHHFRFWKCVDWANRTQEDCESVYETDRRRFSCLSSRGRLVWCSKSNWNNR